MNEIKSFDIKINSYTVKAPKNNLNGDLITVTFEDDNFLIARDKAILLAKEYRKELNNYRGIQLILNYLEKNAEGKYRKKKYKILTGWRMGSEKILPHLDFEANLLIQTNTDFPVIETEFENHNYLAVNQNYITLYYFTVL
jgi:hypothetical protein